MEIPTWKKKNLIGVQSLSQSEIRKILKLAKFFKKSLGIFYSLIFKIFIRFLLDKTSAYLVLISLRLTAWDS